MRNRKKSFRHHSLQDEKSLQDILKAVSSGIARGKITFSDEDEKIVMRPEGLLELKVTALETFRLPCLAGKMQSTKRSDSL